MAYKLSEPNLPEDKDKIITKAIGEARTLKIVNLRFPTYLSHFTSLQTYTSKTKAFQKINMGHR